MMLLVFLFTLLVSMWSFSDCYDPLDPNGNIEVTFDTYKWTTNGDGYMAKVTIQNNYQYRYVDKPGWKLSWTWANNEVIWTMSGAFATLQGNCSSFKYQIPHSCRKSPVIMDLMPDTLPENRSCNCCHGGILSARAIDPQSSFTSFELMVGNLRGKSTGQPPQDLTLMAPGPGYTCGPVLEVAPTVIVVIGGQRREQVFRTWKSTCTYSSFLGNKTPVCCVSLSSFYNPEITPCPKCSCGCREASPSTTSCVREGRDVMKSGDTLGSVDTVQCTDHMCPVRVHWHIKNNYQDYWRVKLTISNYAYIRNYSNWNVLVQHPGLGPDTTTYSFNSSMLPTVGFQDEISLLWGIQNYNTELLHADRKQVGSVSTEMLLKKDANSFTLSSGWPYPRRIYFAGENCEMPLPDTFPMLPNGGLSQRHTQHQSLLLLAVCFVFIVIALL